MHDFDNESNMLGLLNSGDGSRYTWLDDWADACTLIEEFGDRKMSVKQDKLSEPNHVFKEKIAQVASFLEE